MGEEVKGGGKFTFQGQGESQTQRSAYIGEKAARSDRQGLAALKRRARRGVEATFQGRRRKGEGRQDAGQGCCKGGNLWRIENARKVLLAEIK